jgi:hypothetical protein
MGIKIKDTTEFYLQVFIETFWPYFHILSPMAFIPWLLPFLSQSLYECVCVQVCMQVCVCNLVFVFSCICVCLLMLRVVTWLISYPKTNT